MGWDEVGLGWDGLGRNERCCLIDTLHLFYIHIHIYIYTYTYTVEEGGGRGVFFVFLLRCLFIGWFFGLGCYGFWLYLEGMETEWMGLAIGIGWFGTGKRGVGEWI
jgi:hypothetical protein